MSKLGDLYKDLFYEFKKGKKGDEAQKQFNTLWSEAKQKYPVKDELAKWATDLLQEYRRNNQTKKSSNILFYCSKKKSNIDSEKTSSSTSASILPKPCSSLEPSPIVKVEENAISTSLSEFRKRKASDSGEDTVPTTEHPARPTPAQDKLKSDIILLQSELDLALRRRDAPSASGSEHLQIKKIQDKIEKCKKELKKKEKHVLSSQTHRRTVKAKMELACQKNPDVASLLKTRSVVGRPRLEVEQPTLLSTIVDLAMFGASAEERRRCEIVRTCRTLDDLHQNLKELGFDISRSSTYLRLLPRNYATTEGKRHVNTVPVKLSRPEADHHRAHPDQNFCVATIRSIETIASILGPNEAFFLSQDDKARVPIGITAAHQQAPLLMHVDYRVSLPDHDWVVATKHKLIPSVYAGCTIKPNDMGRSEAVSYSGPTYVAIRSGKHGSSTATSHAQDFNTLTTLEPFKDIMKNSQGQLKPVILVSSDGGPDENPRYVKVISHAVHHFITHDLDAIFVFTNAPGRSAFNRVERRMAPLSRELSGVILPHDFYGSHLDAQGNTIDSDLETKNFKKAGDVLAEIWGNTIIDGYKVLAEYIEPNNDDDRPVPDLPSPKWYSEHVRESQYLLQVTKCDDRSCCAKMRSSLRVVLPERFLTPPFPVTQSEDGLCVPNPEDHDGKSFASFFLRQSLVITPKLGGSYHNLKKVPYDLYCPSLKTDQQVIGRTCQNCGIYFCSKKNVATHRSLHKEPKKKVIVRPRRIVTRRMARDAREVLCVIREDDCAEWQYDEDVEDVGGPRTTTTEADVCPIISIEEIYQSPWTDDSGN